VGYIYGDEGGLGMPESTIELISEITVLNDMTSFMNDPTLDEALAMIIKLITKPDVPASRVPPLIVQLQAMSAKFQVLSRYYTTFEKGIEASKKKNVYYTMADALDKLAGALKYQAKMGV
jgi:hypothetical protein